MNERELRDFARTVLTSRQFRIWDLAENGQHTHREIAIALGITKSTVTGTIFEARIKLVRALGHTPPDGNASAPAKAHPDRDQDAAGEARRRSVRGAAGDGTEAAAA